MLAVVTTMWMSVSSCDSHVNAQTAPVISGCIAHEIMGALNTGHTAYICTGPQSKRFHKTSHCRGLNSCSGEILAVSISKAQSMRRTPCKWCYK